MISGPDAACIGNVSDIANFVSTQLDGGLSNVGTVNCVGSYDGAFMVLNATCN